MAARLTVLGSGTAVPTPRRAPAAHLVTVGGERLLLDTGAGALRQLAAVGVGPDEVGRVFYTHYHVDHVAELPLLLFVLRHPGLDRPRSLEIYGPRGLGRLRAGLEELFGEWVVPRAVRVHWREVAAGWEGTFPWGRVRTGGTRHVPGSLAYRFEFAGGGSLAYTGDTGPSSSLARFVAGVDVLLCECSLVRAGPEALHLDPETAGRLAAAAGVKRLILTHFYPPVDGVDAAAAAGAHYGGPVVLAEDLTTYAVP